MKFQSLKGIVIVILLSFPIWMSASFKTDSFSAEMIQKMKDQSIQGKLFVKGNKYRMDMTEEGKKISIIVDIPAHKTKLLIHSQKISQEISNTSLKSLSNNPFEAFRYSSEKYESKKSGSEILNGYECQKNEIYDKENKLMTVWMSDELGWPIKIVLEVEPSREVELINIKEEPVEESLFQIPSTYKEMSSPKKDKVSPTSDETKTRSEKRELDTKGLTALEKAVFEKLEEKNIQRVTKDGTVQIRERNDPALGEYFLHWKIFRLSREKKIQGGTSFSYIPVDRVAVHEESETVLVLSSPATDMPLESGLHLLQEENILLKNKEDVEGLAKALDALYFKRSKVQNIESLGEGEWAVYTGTFINHLKGFLIKVDSSGKIIEFKYSLKIKER